MRFPLNEIIKAIKPVDDPQLRARLWQRWDSLTKPRRSLGRLEELLVHYALIKRTDTPKLESKGLYVFCGDHGIVAEGVSAYPQAVTHAMLTNFVQGGAAINVLARLESLEVEVVDVAVNGPPVPGTRQLKILPGTRNFLYEPALTEQELEQCLGAGARLAEEASLRFDVVGIGEMGIGNSTSASAITAALLGLDPELVTGPGAGLPQERLPQKIAIIRQAIKRHHLDASDPLRVLQCVGGGEIAAMTGFILAAARYRLPVVIDGFISSASALVAAGLCPASLSACIFSHFSAEPGHQHILSHLGVQPLLNLEMRLGEGTGAALAIHLLEGAVRLYNEMATFDQARVPDKAEL